MVTFYIVPMVNSCWQFPGMTMERDQPQEGGLFRCHCHWTWRRSVSCLTATGHWETHPAQSPPAPDWERTAPTRSWTGTTWTVLALSRFLTFITYMWLSLLHTHARTRREDTRLISHVSVGERDTVYTGPSGWRDTNIHSPHCVATPLCGIIHNHRHVICTVCCFVAVSQDASELVLQERSKAQCNLRWTTCVFRCRYVLLTFFYFGTKVKKNRTIRITFVF